MSDKKCSYVVTDGVAVMTVDNPPVNALSATVLTDIRAAIEEALNDDAVRVIVFTGAGSKAFIAGADITEFVDLNEKQAGSDFLKRGQEITNLIENANKPFIAAINGFALGGGLEFALACHIRIADERASLGLPEINLGLIPGYGGTQRTTRLLGKARAMELILTGKPIKGAKAAELGLVNHSVPAGTVVEEATKLAKIIAGKSRMNISAAMKAISQGPDLPMDQAMKFERDLFGEVCETDDKREGIAAFLEKRDADFKDR